MNRVAKNHSFYWGLSQGGVIEELLPPTEIMESLERIESLGERAAKV